MDKILAVLQASGIPFAYDHFAEGEAVDHRSSATCFREVIILLLMGRCITRSAG